MTFTLPFAATRAGRADSEAALIGRREVAETLCAGLALVGLGYALMHGGGRDEGATEVALGLTAPSLLAGRIWSNVPLRELILAASVAIVAVVVPFVTPLGVSQVSDLNSYLYAVALYLAARSYARAAEHRRVLAVGLLALAVVESLDVVRVWAGERDPSFQVVGTFYWHNQFGVYAAAVALLATAMVMRSNRVEDAIAWLVAPLFLALTELSHSRAAALAFLLGAAALLGVSLLRSRWWALARAALAIGLAVAVHAVFLATVAGHGTGHGFSPGKDTLSSTSSFRLTAGEEAAKVFAHAPLLSHGYGSLAAAGWQHTAPNTTTSPYAHSAELQSLVDGGLLLGIPVIVAVLVMAAATFRGLRRSMRRDCDLDWVRLGAVIAAGTMLVHTSMDFDTQWPVLTATLAMLVALSLPEPRVSARASNTAIRMVLVVVPVVSAIVASLLVGAYWQTTQRLASASGLLATDSAQAVAMARDLLDHHDYVDPRPATFVVEATDMGFVFDDATLQRALRESRDFAGVDPVFHTEWQRVAANADTAG